MGQLGRTVLVARRIGVRALDLGFCQFGDPLLAVRRVLTRIGIRPQICYRQRRLEDRHRIHRPSTASSVRWVSDAAKSRRRLGRSPGRGTFAESDTQRTLRVKANVGSEIRPIEARGTWIADRVRNDK